MHLTTLTDELFHHRKFKRLFANKSVSLIYHQRYKVKDTRTISGKIFREFYLAPGGPYTFEVAQEKTKSINDA